MALDADVLEAVGGVPRLEHVAGSPGGDDLVDLAERSRRRRQLEVVVRDVAGGVERLAVDERRARCPPGRGRAGAPSR